MVLQLTVLLIALSLPGLLLRRSGGPWARLCALLAMLVVAWATLDRPELLLHSVPARLTVVATAPVDDALRSALRVAVGREVELEFAAGSHHPGDRLAGASLDRRSDPDLALVFNGRFPRRPGRPGVNRSGKGIHAQVLTARPVLRLDPDAVRVRSKAGISRGRPAFFEVLLGAPGDDRPSLRGRLRVLEPGGRVVCDAALGGDAVQRVEWRPKVEGRHRVQLVLWVGAGREPIEMRGEGALDVTAPTPITIVGAASASLSDALRVQGQPVLVVKDLPAKLVGTLVLLDPLAVAEQVRVRRFIEDGGGVFLVGGRTGGALPPPTEPLGAIAPVIRKAIPPVDDKAGKSAGESSKPRSTDSDDSPPGDKDRDPPEEEAPATGDTSGAKLKIEERDVHRRSIAMVLVVDRSGSMLDTVEARGEDGQLLTKMDLAKVSALHTATALDDDDLLAVISFGSTATVVLPLSPVQNRNRIHQRLEGLQAKMSETTHVAAALDDARRMLVGSKAAVKHVVIVTDGAIHDAGPRYFGGLSAARKFHTEKTGITLSLVQAVPFSKLEAGTATRAKGLAAAGNGVLLKDAKRFFFHLESFEHVPRLLSAEVRSLRTKAGRPADKPKPGETETKPLEQSKKVPEPKPVPKQVPTPPIPDPLAGTLEVFAIDDSSPLLAPLPKVDFPRIGGILDVEARGEAMTLLAAGTHGIPLLVFANRGLGKVGVWTSDFLGRWGADFSDDEAFPGRLGQWIQFLAPARTLTHGLDLIRRPQVTPGVALPEDVAELEHLGGNPIASLDKLVLPSPMVASKSRGRAEPDAIYGILLLVFLALVEFLAWRRPSPTD